MSANHDFDVIILGAGLVGMSAALAFEQSGYRVALMDPQALTTEHNDNLAQWDSRIYAISPGNMDWLISLGIEPYLDVTRIAPVEKMCVYGDETGSLAFAPTNDMARISTSFVNYILESRQLLLALTKRFVELSIPFYCARPTDVEVGKSSATLILQDGQVLTAKLLVGADGANSWLRQPIGVNAKTHDYHQMGVVANFRISGDHHQTATQWFTGEAILACLPLPDQHLSIVWSVEPEYAQTLLALSQEALCERLSEATQNQYGELKLVTPPNAFPLKRVILNTTIAARMVLVGDAAHVVHPLAGQGVNLGFRDVVSLLNEIKQAKRYEDIGDYLLLRRYERERKTDVMSMMAVTHGLKYLFQHPATPMKWVRNTGLSLVDKLPILKNQLIKQATL